MYGTSWLRSQLFEVEWPDVSAFFTSDSLPAMPDGLLDAVQKVMPFCPDPKFPIVTLDELGVHTAEGDMGATVGDFQLPHSKYRAEPLLLVLEQATAIDMTKYPAHRYAFPFTVRTLSPTIRPCSRIMKLSVLPL